MPRKGKIHFAPLMLSSFNTFIAFCEIPSNSVLHFYAPRPSIYYPTFVIRPVSTIPYLSYFVKKFFSENLLVTAPCASFSKNRPRPLATTQRPDEPRNKAKKERTTPPPPIPKSSVYEKLAKKKHTEKKTKPKPPQKSRDTLTTLLN